MTFTATAAAALYCDLEPVFVDINEYDLNINFEDLQKKYTKDCVAVIPVNVGGHPCEMEKIIPWAKKKKLLVINSIKIKHLFGLNSKYRSKKVFNKSWQVRFWHVWWSSFYYHRKHYGLLFAIKCHFFKFFRFNYLKFYYKLIGNENESEL